MAILNGKRVDFTGLTFKRIGEVIFEASPRGDGKDITLELFPDEEEAFLRYGGLFIGRTICKHGRGLGRCDRGFSEFFTRQRIQGSLVLDFRFCAWYNLLAAFF